MLLFCSFVVSLLFALLFIRPTRDNAHHYDQSKPQRFRIGEMPRVGGGAIFAGVVAIWLLAALAGAIGIGTNVQIDQSFALF